MIVAAQGQMAAGADKLRAASRIVLVVGAVWALFCTLYSGRHNASFVLPAMFAVWVLSPFAGFFWAMRSAGRQGAGIARALAANAMVVTVIAAAIYGGVAFSTPTHHNAFAFLAVPAASWLAIGAFFIATRFTRRP